MMIPFNKPSLTGKEGEMIAAVLRSGKLAGNGEFCCLCETLLREKCQTSAAMLTPSGTAALEMAAQLLSIVQGEEVILPSFTFPSTANAFALRGANIVFVDIDPVTMNIDADRIAEAITAKTRAIVPVHYSGVACDMDKILSLAAKYRLAVIEDAAMGLLADYKGKALGAIGEYGCISFHNTKNYSMGEGGAIFLRDCSTLPRAEIIRRNGTDINRYERGEVEKYCWQSLGSAFAPSELNAACLLPQLQAAEEIKGQRLRRWALYREMLAPLEKKGYLVLPAPPSYAQHNGHCFFVKAADRREREALISYLARHGIGAASHYQPLHSAPAGLQYGRFHGEDIYTTSESNRLLRLPMFYGLTESEVAIVAEAVAHFYEGRR